MHQQPIKLMKIKEQEKKSITKTKRNISISRSNNKVTLAVVAVAMAVALSLAVLPAFTTNQAYAKIQEVDIGSENPAGHAAPGQQPKATGQAQTQFTELQNPIGLAPLGQNR